MELKFLKYLNHLVVSILITQRQLDHSFLKFALNPQQYYQFSYYQEKDLFSLNRAISNQNENDILNVNEKNLSTHKLIVFGNLPYNISTEILCKWILNLDKEKFWFENLILMFQKEVADRIIADVNTSNYGRLSILAKWKLNISKICDINRSSFRPKPKIESTLLIFKPKKKFFKINKATNIELITRYFFNHRRKMIKKPFNQLFNGNDEIKRKLRLNLDLRPQNLNLDTYYNLAKEYENLTS